MLRKLYAVRRGRQTGVFDSWTACEPLVSGFPGARFESFTTWEQVEAFILGMSPLWWQQQQWNEWVSLIAKQITKLVL